MDPPPECWGGSSLPNFSSSTYCELCGILDAVSLLSQRGLSAVVICDSQAPLKALSSVSPTCTEAVSQILSCLALANIILKFVWVPSHINIFSSNRVDGLAKAACVLPPPPIGLPTPLSRVLTCIRETAHRTVYQGRENQREESATIRHYDSFRNRKYMYRRRGVMMRRHIVVSVRLRLGYSTLWEVARIRDVSQFSFCPLCGAEECNTLEHHCLHCPELDDLLPRNVPLVEVCKHLMNHDNLDKILARYPKFTIVIICLNFDSLC